MLNLNTSARKVNIIKKFKLHQQDTILTELRHKYVKLS